MKRAGQRKKKRKQQLDIAIQKDKLKFEEKTLKDQSEKIQIQQQEIAHWIEKQQREEWIRQQTDPSHNQW